MSLSALTSCAADSLARPSQLPESDSAIVTTDGFGLISSEAFATFDRGSSRSKTSQACLALETTTTGDNPLWEPFSETWPESGTMRNGKCYRRPTSARRNNASESGSWPTLDAGAFNLNDTPENFERRRQTMIAKNYNGNGAGMPLGIAVQAFADWPTPTRRSPDDCPSERERRSPSLDSTAQSWSTPTADDANKITRASGQIASLARDTTNWATPRAEDGERGKASQFDGLSEDARNWSTPAAQDAKNGSLPPSQQTRDTLPADAMNWSTPKANDAEKRGDFDPTDPRTGLAGQVRTWATPMGNESHTRPQTFGRGNPNLEAMAATWATPTEGDASSSGNRNGPNSNAHIGQSLTDQSRLFSNGPIGSPSPAPMEPCDESREKRPRVGLNHRFGLLLQGFPASWLDSVPLVTRSSRSASPKGRSKSSPSVSRADYEPVDADVAEIESE